jgi:energy-coupling factor transport system permease protein
MDLLRSLPIGLYLEQPVTWLHQVDPRVKLVWLLGFLLSPISAGPIWRLSLVGMLLLLTLATRVPFRVWRRQMGLVIIFSLLLFFVTMLAPDGLNVNHQSRLPENELAFLEAALQPTEQPTDEPVGSAIVELPQPTGYRYVLIQEGRVTVTRRSLELAIRAGTLMFVLIYSTNLYLLTTAPEEITAGLDNLMQPLRRFNVPVTEIVLTLTLSLRFIPLVLEEIQNLVRSVRTRAINWKKLGFRGTTQVWLMISERLLDNLLLRAEQIANAMQVRGFTSPNQHQVRWYQFRLRLLDWAVLLGAGAFWSARIFWGYL